ncbi:MotA/TolQ/ExbB proton channel family protein [Janthinobacterium sp. 17J80-10]|uniref:MotA/TolQ/ExbB proton channel family protein n=1 Tax=Janthinobacterium sp. 17J80-10 TaxID=2497863 RepID=UPI0010054737|nr:MotA/TolQ/ExbB proton channel family protein [Janthinobacterium sp. 17J80-10]QAU35718.1 MotA/TolQ/ExbB proton channel family protein [Janthinobacterium sp. 17J80-10]
MKIRSRLSALVAIVTFTMIAATLTAPHAFAEEAMPAAASSLPAPAQESTPAAAPAAAPAADTVAVDNPYGLDALWNAGDFVAKGTLIILVLMSMGSWYIIITKLIDQMRIGRQAADAREKFWKAPSLQGGIGALASGSPFRFIAESGVKASEHHDGALLEQIDLNTWVTMSVQRTVEKVQSRLQDGLAFLATVGSTAPFVGLFGTVWGIYHALTAIGVAGQASIDKVAGPVGEALIMTAIGLAVAVPAVLGYNWLVRRNKAAMEDVRSFSADLHMVLLSGVMSTRQSAQVQSAKKIA